MKENTKDLTCIYCLKLPTLDEVFIAKVTEDDIIQISMCLICGDDGSDNKEVSGSWITIQRKLDGWYVLDIYGEFSTLLTYFDSP